MTSNEYDYTHTAQWRQSPATIAARHVVEMDREHWLARSRWRSAGGWPYLLWGLEEGLQCWENQTVVDEIIDKPLPDLNELNGSIPQAQWEAGLDGHPRPPYV